MTDPYQVLGVSRSASDDEIKKAYRTLSRKYHPDANINNPNKAQAEEKFKEVQQAYDQIIKGKQNGGYSDSGYGNRTSAGGNTNTDYGYGPFGGFSGRYTYDNAHRTSEDEENPKVRAAGNFIRNGYYNEAVKVLGEVPFSERKGRWYYYSAIANEKLGNSATAVEHIQRAVAFEPDNIQYRQFQQYLEFGGTWYSNMGSTYGRPDGSGNVCCSLLGTWLCCQCMPFCC